MFEQFRTRMWTPGGSVGRDFGTLGRGGESANLDLKKHGEEYVFVADLPGFEREEIDLTFADGTLTLVAETETREETATDDGEATGEGGEIAIRGELARSRRMSERVAIPEEVREDEITASYRNGVLEVHLPLAETDDEDGGKKIDIAD